MPDDADVLIIAGPKTDFLAPEIDALKAYLAKPAASCSCMLDPVLKADQPQPTGLQGLLKEWGIDADNDIVLDVSGMGRLLGTDESVPVAASYPSHPITENFNLMTAYPLARSMTPIEGGINGHTAQRLVETSREQLGRDEPEESDRAASPPRWTTSDKKGPVSLAVAGLGSGRPYTAGGRREERRARPEAGRNAARRVRRLRLRQQRRAGRPGNRDLFLNTINWLAQQENLIAIRPRDPEDRRITLTADQERRIFYLTVLIVPGLVLLAGVQTWWRRR